MALFHSPPPPFCPTLPQVLSAIEPPYSAALTAAFTPVLANRDITDSMRSEDGSDLVTAFLGGSTALGVGAWGVVNVSMCRFE